MNQIIRTFAGIIIISTVAACYPPIIQAGDVEVVKSKFDGSQYVSAEPGWIRAIGAKGLEASVLMQSALKIGAFIHSETEPVLVVRVGAISRIFDLELNVDGQVHKLPRKGLTDIRTTGSRAEFSVNLGLLHQITSGTGTVLVRVTTSKGYVEGDFGADCDSRWPDRACVAIRNALAKAKAMGMLDR